MRAPKSGPQALNVRFAADGVNISSPSSPSLSTSTTTKRTSSSSQSTGSMSLVVPIPTKKPKTGNGSVRRPIATNSRIEQMQDEKMKKDMYLAFILDALDKMSKGITAPFNELLDQFNPHKQASSSSSSTHPSQSTTSPTTLRLWLSSLSHVVSRLEPIHSPLIHSIVQMPWTTFDPATVRSYTVFIGMLVSARPEYLSMVLGMVVRGFTYHSGLKATHIHPSPTSPSSPPLTRRLIYTRLHSLLSHLLTLIPTLPSTLEPLLISNFPHKRHDLKSQVTYIRNLLRVSGYCPEIGHTVLGTVVDRAIQIDVEIQVEIEELEALETQSDTEVFTLDPFDTLIGQESDHSDTEETHGDDDDDIDDNMSDLSSSGGFDDEDEAPREELRAKPKMIHEMVKKLDAILELVFEYFQESREGLSGSTTGGGGEETVQPLSALPPLPDLPPLESPSLLTPTALNPFYPFPSISAPPQLQTVSTPTLSSSSIPPSISTPSTPSLPQTTTKTQKRTRTSLLSQFHTLLSIFDRTILRTFKSRYTQFLVFWYTSLDREFSDLFQGMLVERALLGSGEDSIMDAAASFGGGMGGGGGLKAITPTVTRAAAASYIGSYVSRAEFVNGEETRAIVGVLCSFLGGHLDEIEDELRESGALTSSGVNGNGYSSTSTRGTNAAANILVGSTAQNTVWYAVVQAVFLIFCFRWRDLLVDEDGEALDGGEVDVEVLVGVGESRFGGGGGGDGVGGGGRWLPGLSVLKRVVQCVLNPLKVCSPNVVNQFAKIAHTTNFLYCYTILEANKRSDYSSSSASSSSTSPPDSGIPSGGIHPAILESAVNPELNSFFPFDPYRLPRSGRFIEGIYREWGSVAVGDDEDDSDSDLDGEGEGEGDDQEEMEDEEEEERDDMKADLGGYLSGPRSSSPVMIFGGGGRREEEDEDEEELGQSLDKMSISPMRPGLKARMAGM